MVDVPVHQAVAQSSVGQYGADRALLRESGLPLQFFNAAQTFWPCCFRPQPPAPGRLPGNR